MTVDQSIATAIIIGIVVLFVWNRLRYDLVALLGLLAAMATGIVPSARAFAGFADPVVIIIASALVVSAGVSKSGVIGRIIRRMEPRLRTSGRRVAALTGSVMVLSAFMKNIGALAIFLPIAVQVARRGGSPASELLMPMAFGSLIGGLVTLVGTSPNILVSRVRTELVGEPFAMFDFAPVGLGIVAVGFAFLSVGWRLLPAGRRTPASAAAAFDIEPYLSEARLPATSPLVGKTVADLEAIGDGSVTVAAIVREKERRYTPAGDWTLFADDILVLLSDPHALRAIVTEARLQLGDTGRTVKQGLAAGDMEVVEAVVTPRSTLLGRSASELRLRQRFGLTLIGISRHGERTMARIRNVRFRSGDVLVLRGSAAAMTDTLRDLGCLPLVDRATGLGRGRRDHLPLILLALAMGAVALDLVPVAAAFFGAAVLMVLFGILTLREAYDALELPILVLLACLIPISDAITSTGMAALIAGGLAAAAGALPPVGTVTLVLVTAMALTPFLNNAATALIMAPIAANLAQKLGMNADPLLMAVAVGSACDFLTPIGHQCNTLVMGPGGYRFGDYWRLGLPLSVLVVVVGSVLIPVFWGLR
ncbi:SLC13 family permease [Azospirillum sp. RWY-5-1]|uniref:SLC13 family permease n=1 Tax=Azospirillum oleiclasticum TaxID=2735135 RepID=A0ABX2T2Y3_9PROT|nr:SLC13 family permease [Azospirillum oleiclasticum]NYZ11452.1 SLC13 family permease [Azospirillum oleiclasticum]NYZ18613.1 SLC13 family permease [Azospirillum oleiclasticum]